MRCEIISQCHFDLCFSNDCDIENYFICLLAICKFMSFFDFSIKVVFFICFLKNSFYILLLLST